MGRDSLHVYLNFRQTVVSWLEEVALVLIERLYPEVHRVVFVRFYQRFNSSLSSVSASILVASLAALRMLLLGNSDFQVLEVQEGHLNPSILRVQVESLHSCPIIEHGSELKLLGHVFHVFLV